MKVNDPIFRQSIDKTICELQALNLNDIKVFLAWMNDAPSFVCQQRLISERTGIKRQNVYKSFKHLVELRVLQVVGKEKQGRGWVNDYILGTIFEKNH